MYSTYLTGKLIKKTNEKGLNKNKNNAKKG